MTTEKILEAQEFSNDYRTLFCKKCHKPVFTLTPKMKMGKLTTKCPDGHENIFDFGGKEVVTDNKKTVPDPNAGKRASLEAQIKAYTGVVANLQTQMDNWNGKLKTAQDELKALPPAPTA